MTIFFPLDGQTRSTKKKKKTKKGPTRSCSLSRDEISSIATNVCIHIKYTSFLCTGRVFWVFGG